MYNNGTLIIIDIQADNKVEILECIEASFAFMPGWKMENGSLFGGYFNTRIFAFDMTNKTFVELRPNNSYSDTMDGDEIIIKDLADISELLEYIFLNGETLRQCHTLKSPWVTWDNDIDINKPFIPKEFMQKQMAMWEAVYGSHDKIFEKTKLKMSSLYGEIHSEYLNEGIAAKPAFDYQVAGGNKIKYPAMVKLKIPSKVDWKIKMAPNGMSFKSNEDIIDAHASYAATMAATAMMSLQEAHWSGE